MDKKKRRKFVMTVLTLAMAVCLLPVMAPPAAAAGLDKIYYTEAKEVNGDNSTYYRLRRANLSDGSGQETLYWSELGTPESVAVDLDAGYVYFSDPNTSVGEIYRCDLDGNNKITLISGVYANALNLLIYPPTLSSTSASSVTSSGATLNFTSDKAGTYYYLVYAAADAAPSAATIKAQGAAVAKGTGEATASPNNVNVSGLSASTPYKAYVIVMDANGNKSEVSTIEFTTSAATPDTWDGSIAGSFAGGDGSSGSPYLIATGAQLARMADRVNNDNANYGGKYYILTANIDLNGSNYKWTPIGNTNDLTGNNFRGTFDGAGHMISNLAIGTPGSADTTFINAGLFGYVYQGTVKDVGLVNVSIFSQMVCAGGLAGYWNGTGDATPVTNCYVTGSVSGGHVPGDNGFAGSLIGRADYCNVSNCCATASVTGGENAWAGGLLGKGGLPGSVTSCFATGSVSSSGSMGCAGGLIGLLEEPITNCYATGNTSCSDTTYVGGLIGYRSSGTVTSCYYNSSATQVSGGTPQAAIGVGEGTDDATAKTLTQMKDPLFVTTLNIGYSGT